MLKILVNAYACCPGMGSEQGMAWNWCSHLAKHCELYIITEEEYRYKIEVAVAELPQGKNMHFFWNRIGHDESSAAKIRRMCWNQGDWRFYKYYKEWQWRTYEMALDIVKYEKIDVLHQLNMIGFREPGYLWNIPGIPLVWGPVDAKESFPVGYLKDAPLKNKLFIKLKNFITGLQLRYSQRLKRMVNRADVIVSASSNSLATFRKYFHIESPVINETGCGLSGLVDNTDSRKDNLLHLLWVGKLDFRKQLRLAIDTLEQVSPMTIRLHVVGGGNKEPYLYYAEKLGVADYIDWHGSVCHEKVQHLMRKYDVLFFTSVAEGTPHVVLEAIANGLPVVCIDTCGHGDSIDDTCGIKIPLTDYEQSKKDFAKVLNELYQDRQKLQNLSEGCMRRAKELCWDNKIKQMVQLYKRVVNV